MSCDRETGRLSNMRKTKGLSKGGPKKGRERRIKWRGKRPTTGTRITLTNIFFSEDFIKSKFIKKFCK